MYTFFVHPDFTRSDNRIISDLASRIRNFNIVRSIFRDVF